MNVCNSSSWPLLNVHRHHIGSVWRRDHKITSIFCGVFIYWILCGYVSQVKIKSFNKFCTYFTLTSPILIHPGFETHVRHHQKSKTGASVAPQKEFMSSKNFFKTFFFLIYLGSGMGCAPICCNFSTNTHMDKSQ